MALLAASCGAADRVAPPRPPVVPSGATGTLRAIDASSMDTSVPPGTDFYLYANGAWLARAEIPGDNARTGSHVRNTEIVEKRTRQIVEEAAENAPAGSELRKVGDYYASVLDEGAIEARGLDPLRPALDAIAGVSDARSLSALLGSQLRADADPLNASEAHSSHVLALFVEQDLRDPPRSAAYLLQGGIGLPDRSYYLDDSPRGAGLRARYGAHLAAVMRLAGLADAEGKAARVLAFETKMAEAHATRAETNDVSKGNNLWSRAEFSKNAPGMDWDAFFRAAGLGEQEAFYVWHPRAVIRASALVASEPLATWKEYLVVRAIERAAPLLPRAFVGERFAFYWKDLRGLTEAPPRWRMALDATNAALGQAVGRAYVERFFPPESRKGVEEIVANEIAAYRARIDALSWMAPATKARAEEKLAALRVGVGYPDVWRDYAGLQVLRGDALGNAERAELFEYQRRVAKLGRPVDRDVSKRWPPARR